MSAPSSIKRLTLDMTAAEHRVLKERAANKGQTMRDLILELLRREGLIEDRRSEPTNR